MSAAAAGFLLACSINTQTVQPCIPLRIHDCPSFVLPICAAAAAAASLLHTPTVPTCPMLHNAWQLARLHCRPLSLHIHLLVATPDVIIRCFVCCPIHKLGRHWGLVSQAGVHTAVCFVHKPKHTFEALLVLYHTTAIRRGRMGIGCWELLAAITSSTGQLSAYIRCSSRVSPSQVLPTATANDQSAPALSVLLHPTG